MATESQFEPTVRRGPQPREVSAQSREVSAKIGSNVMDASGPFRASAGQPEDLGHTIHSGGRVQLSRAAQAVHVIHEQAPSRSHRGGTHEPAHTPGSVDLHKPVSQCRGLWTQEISSSRAKVGPT